MQVWANPKVTAEQLITLRHSVAKLLSEATGEQWTYAPKGTDTFRDHHIKGPGGAEISIHHSQEKNGQLIVSGWSENYGEVPAYHRNVDSQMPFISVSFERGPLVLVREMQRRFMPKFLSLIKWADDYLSNRSTEQREQAHTFACIKAALSNKLGGTKNEAEMCKEDGSVGILWTKLSLPFQTNIEVFSADSVTFKIDAKDHVTAVQIARFIAGL